MYDISVVILYYTIFWIVLCMKVWLVKQVILICRAMIEKESAVVEQSISIDNLEE